MSKPHIVKWRSIMTSTQLEKVLLSLVGEFSVAAQLCLRGYVANLTLKNYPGVDIFAYNPKTARSFSLQVKAALQKNDNSFTATHPFIIINATKDELDQALDARVKSTYVFVYVSSDKSSMEYFITPATDLKRMVKEEFTRWWDQAEHRRTLEELAKAKQVLAISITDLQSYKDRWDLLEASQD